MLTPFIKEQFSSFFKENYFVNEKGKIKAQDKNRYYQPIEVANNFQTFWNTMHSAIKKIIPPGEDKPFTNDDLLNAIDDEIKNLTPKKGPEIDIYAYLKNWILKSNNFDVDEAFTQIRFKADGQNYYSNSNIDQLINHLKSIAETDEVLACFRLSTIEATVKRIAAECNNMTQNLVAKKIAYDPECEKATERFLEELYKFLDVKLSMDIFKVVMKHWMWLIKRKITNQDVVWHLWVNIYGGTGIGKTYIIRNLCNPFGNYYIESKISVLMDETREIGKFTDKYIINFEELAVNREKVIGGDTILSKDDIGTLKAFITGEKKSTRVYGTQIQATNDITVTPISTANEHLYDTIFDETTMRRYFEIPCGRTKPGTNEERAGINKFLEKDKKTGKNKAEYIWRGINENLDRGYWEEGTEVAKKISEIQASYYPTKSTIVYWNKYFKFVEDKSYKSQESYEAYSNFCKNYGFKSKSLANFNNEMARRFPELIGRDGLPHFRPVVREAESTAAVNEYLR